MNRVELQGLRASRLVKARLLQWRLLARRRPPARWFGGAGGGSGDDSYLENVYGGPTTRARGTKPRFVL